MKENFARIKNDLQTFVDYSTSRHWSLEEMMSMCAMGVGVDMNNFPTMPTYSEYDMPMEPLNNEPNNDDEFESMDED